jgi:TP901 family phage tail tape measure protein
MGVGINAGTIFAYLELDTSKFTSGFKSAINDLKVFSDKSATAQQKLNGLGSVFQSTGSLLTKSVTLPLVGVGTASVKLASDFEARMSEVKAISGATAKDFDNLKKKAIEMGAKTKFSAGESADAFKYMAMAGWDAESMMSGIEGIMDLAAASGEDLATTSDIVTDALTAFGLQASDSAHFADVLAKASSKSNTNVGLMGETFKYVAPVAGALGYSVEDCAIAIGVMANNGIKGSQAGTALRSMFTRLAKPTDQVAKAMKQYNISLTDANGNMKPLRTLLVEMRERFDGLSESEAAQLAATLAGQEGMSGLLAIMNTSEGDFNSLAGEIDNASGSAQDMADIMMDNTAGAIEQLKGALESAGIIIGEKLTPYIRALAEKITELVEKFNSLSESEQDSIIKHALLAASIGPILLMVGSVLKAIGSVVTIIETIKGLGIIEFLGGISAPVWGAIAAVAALALAFADLWKNSDEFKQTMTDIAEKIGAAWSAFCDEFTAKINELGFNFEDVTDILQAVWKTFCEVVKPLFEGAFDSLADVIQGVLSIILSIMDVFIGLFTGDWEQLGDGILGILSALVEAITGVLENIFNILGGMVGALLRALGLDEAADAVEGFFETIGDFFGNIPEYLSEAGDAIGSFFTETIPEFFDNAVETVTGFFEGIGEKISGFIDDIISFFTETIPDAFNTFISETIPNAIDSIVQWFEQLPYKIGYLIGQIAGFFYNMGTSIIDWVTNDLPEIIGNIVDWFKELPGKIWDWLCKVVDDIGQWGSDLIDKATTAVTGFIDTVINFFKELPGNIWNWLVSVVEKIKQWGSDMKQKAIEIGTKFKDTLVNFFKNLPSNIMGFLKSIPEKVTSIGKSLKEAGKNIFNKLWEGLKSVGESILGWFQGFVDKIKSFVSGIVDGFKSVVSGADDAKKASESVNGSHALGLDYVPYNGYIAELHKGERVLTAQENEEYNAGRATNGGDTFVFYNTKPDPYEYSRQMKRAKRDLEFGY